MFLDEVLAPIQAAGAANPWGSGAPSPAALPSAHGTLLACSTGLAHNKVMGQMALLHRAWWPEPEPRHF